MISKEVVSTKYDIAASNKHKSTKEKEVTMIIMTNTVIQPGCLGKIC